MKLFRTADDKIIRMGFTKTSEKNGYVRYERPDLRYGFTQVVEIMPKQSGRHIISSYDPELTDSKNIGNTGVGLTAYEMELFAKAAKRRGLYSRMLPIPKEYEHA